MIVNYLIMLFNTFQTFIYVIFNAFNTKKPQLSFLVFKRISYQ